MVYAIVALFGLAFGSFLNVCISRLPAGRSIIAPRSRCPQCGHAIRWYDNVPLASYALLGGRCRDCGARISPVYPLVEFLTAGLALAEFIEYGFTPEFIKWAVLTMLVLVLIFTDLLERRIPHAVTVFGIGAGFLLSGLVPVDSRPLGWVLEWMGYFPEGALLSVLGAASGALAGGGMFYGIGEVFYRLRHKEGLGFGDVMLMLMIGTFAGPALTIMIILLGSLLGTLIAVPLYLASVRFREYPWPYGSFLGIAAIYVSLGGEPLLRAYLALAGIR